MANEKIRNLFDRILGKDDAAAAPPGRSFEGFGSLSDESRAEAGDVEVAPFSAIPQLTPISEPRRAVASRILEQCRNVENFTFTQDMLEFKGTQVPEEYRILKTNLLTLAEQKKIKSFVISSCHHGEGKTTTAVYLSAFLALNRNRKILLVDADLRRPKVKNFLNLRFEYGLEDVIENNVPIQDAIIYSVKDNFAVLPSRKGHSNAPELVESQRMRAMTKEMEEHFDYIIYDTSPVLSTTDPAILGSYVGGILLVVKAGATQREAVTHAKSLLEQGGCVVDGLILTQRKEYLPKYFQRYQYYRDYYHYSSTNSPRPKIYEKPENGGKPPAPGAAAASSAQTITSDVFAPPSDKKSGEPGKEALSA